MTAGPPGKYFVVDVMEHPSAFFAPDAKADFEGFAAVGLEEDVFPSVGRGSLVEDFFVPRSETGIEYEQREQEHGDARRKPYHASMFVPEMRDAGREQPDRQHEKDADGKQPEEKQAQKVEQQA